MKKLTTKLFLCLACTFYTLAGVVTAADDPFHRIDGRLIEKLIVVKSVTDSDMKFHEEFKFDGDRKPPQPFSIFWRLKTGTPDDEKDGMYLAGNPYGDPVLWIKKECVCGWKTRFALDPIDPKEDRGIAFAVYQDKNGSRKAMEFAGFSGAVPVGHKRFAMITDPSEDEAEEDEATFYPVTVFTGEIQGGATGGEGVRTSSDGSRRPSAASCLFWIPRIAWNRVSRLPSR